MPTRLPLPQRLRPKSIRAKVVVLLTAPVVSLMALWGYAVVSTASQVSATGQLRDVNATLTTPINDFTTAVQSERTAAMVYRAAPSSSNQHTLDNAELATDKAVAALRAGFAASSTDTAALSPTLPGRINDLLSSASSLAEGRSVREGRDLATGYDAAVEQAFAVQAGLANADTAADAGGARAVLELARARDALSLQDAIFQSAQVAQAAHPHPELTQAQYLAFVQAAAVQRSLTDGAVPDLRPQDAPAYHAVLDSAAAARLDRAQQAVADAGVGGSLTAGTGADWTSAAGPTLDGLARAEAGANSTAVGTDPYSLSVLGGSGLAVGLGLLGVICSLVLSVRIGRGLVTDLTGLRNTALRLASTRLPAAIRRIHNGEQLDIDAEAPHVRAAAGRSEVGQVAAALATVHRAALRAVAGRAAVLTGVSGVYVGLARRSQVLLHRQLDLLDTMERRTEDPAELEDLFRLDHLTTRMRRHAESLLILSGSAPGRGWRNPVPLLDAVRAGTAETADLTRIQILEVPELWLDGAAVADLVHLVAELAENAAVFSPPHTFVTVRGHEVGAGAVVEIEDRGLGMSDEALLAANERINAADVDLLDSRQLGLFVVNRLAQRLNVRVTLRHSAYGGICAVVFVPKERLGGGSAVGTLGALAGQATEEMLPRYARRARPVEALPSSDNSSAPTPAAPSVEPAPVADPEPVVAEGGLPRRVRQASLAPELRRTAPQDQSGQAQPSPPRRSPEAARATIASLRSGRRRAQSAGAGAEHGTETHHVNPAHGADPTGEAGNR